MVNIIPKQCPRNDGNSILETIESIFPVRGIVRVEKEVAESLSRSISEKRIERTTSFAHTHIDLRPQNRMIARIRL